MRIKFLKYVERGEPYMTPEMTGAPMRGVLRAAASALREPAHDVVNFWYYLLPPRDEFGKQTWLRVEQRPGKVWTPTGSGGPRASEYVGVEGTGVYYLEFGGTHTTATHALKRATGAGAEYTTKHGVPR